MRFVFDLHPVSVRERDSVRALNHHIFFDFLSMFRSSKID